MLTCLDTFKIMKMYNLYLWVFFATPLTVHTLASGHDTEPRCSKFHYDEQLLEKMIRMEHSSNLMMEEFRALKAQVASDLDSVTKEKANVKTVLQEEQDKIRQVLDSFTGKCKII